MEEREGAQILGDRGAEAGTVCRDKGVQQEGDNRVEERKRKQTIIVSICVYNNVTIISL